jgi:hypothetical protein
MRKSNLMFVGIFSLVSLSSFYLISQNIFSDVQAAETEYKCFPFLPNTQTSGQYQVVGGNGEITQSSHPKVLPPGFGRGFSISSGGYNPAKKQIMLVVKDRYISIFLKQPLVDNKSVEFIARPCGSSSSFAERIHGMITSGLFFDSNVFDIPCSFPRPQTFVCFYFQGTLMKGKNKIQGKFTTQSGFHLTTNKDHPELKSNKIYKGFAQGKFTLNLKPGRSNNFPEPTDANAVRGLW